MKTADYYFSLFFSSNDNLELCVVTHNSRKLWFGSQGRQNPFFEELSHQKTWRLCTLWGGAHVCTHPYGDNIHSLTDRKHGPSPREKMATT